MNSQPIRYAKRVNGRKWDVVEVLLDSAGRETWGAVVLTKLTTKAANTAIEEKKGKE